MDIVQAVTTIVSTLVGGGIALVANLVTNWIGVREERKKRLQERYEQTYITEGIDPLMTYFLGLHVQLRSSYLSNHSELSNIDLAPVVALVKIQNLLGNEVLTDISLLIYEYLSDSRIRPVPSKITKQITIINTLLLELRKKLLKTILAKISGKVHQMDEPQIIKDLITLRNELNTSIASSIVGSTKQDQLPE